MTAPLQNVLGRISEIRSRIDSVRNANSGSSFAGVLEAAQRAPDHTEGPLKTAATADPASVRETRRVGTGELVGMLGTPVRVRPGVTVAAGAAYRPYLPPAGPVGDWAAALPERGREWAPAIETAAQAAGVDPRLLASLVWAESTFVPDAVSHSGAIGLTQLMPPTAEGLGVDPWDPIQNLDGGARYLAWTISEFGSLELGLAAYNAGPGNVRRAGGIPNIPETQAYVPKVMNYYRRLGGHA